MFHQSGKGLSPELLATLDLLSKSLVLGKNWNSGHRINGGLHPFSSAEA